MDEQELGVKELINSRIESSNGIRAKVKEWVIAGSPNYFRVEPKRSIQYYYKEREFNYYPDYQIPIGSNDSIRYTSNEHGGTNDRDIISYLDRFDDFDSEDPDLAKAIDQYESVTKRQFFPPELIHYPFKTIDGANPLYGNFKDVFAPNKTVLDLGSGRAVALMQLAEVFQSTNFIGIDKLYKEKRRIYPNKHGLQLTHDDWEDLDQIPDNSIDSILSVQGLTSWGIPDSRGNRTPDQIDADNRKINKIASTLSRIVKSGGVILLEGDTDKSELLKSALDPNVWECKVTVITGRFNFIAKKKTDQNNIQ